MNYLTKQQMRAARTRLTRAINSGDHRKVIGTVAAEFARWDKGEYAYPDDWSNWQRASDDAYHALRLMAPYKARF